MDATTRNTRAQLEAALRMIAQGRLLAQTAAEKDCELAERIDEEVCGYLVDAEDAAQRLLAIDRFKP